MTDPLAQVIALMNPRAVYSKVISGAGSWAVRYSKFGQPSFCTMLEGECVLAVDGQPPLALIAGDFVLMPATPGFTLSSFSPAVPVFMDPMKAARDATEIRHGKRDGPPDVRMLGGYFDFDSPDAGLLVSLLPSLLHMRGVERMTQLVQLVRNESVEQKPARDLILERLVEVLLVEALRSAPCESAPPGLLRAMGDPRLAAALRQIHGNPAHPWTVEDLAAVAALSRSAFFARFSKAVGIPPMEYLISWRMAVAKNLLGRDGLDIAEVAGRVGYSSASTFSTAFARHVGQAPGRFSRVRRAHPRAASGTRLRIPSPAAFSGTP
jgi:AraC-like DNA-binding protein